MVWCQQPLLLVCWCCHCCCYTPERREIWPCSYPKNCTLRTKKPHFLLPHDKEEVGEVRWWQNIWYQFVFVQRRPHHERYKWSYLNFLFVLLFLGKMAFQSVMAKVTQLLEKSWLSKPFSENWWIVHTLWSIMFICQSRKWNSFQIDPLDFMKWKQWSYMGTKLPLLPPTLSHTRGTPCPSSVEAKV